MKLTTTINPTDLDTECNHSFQLQTLQLEGSFRKCCILSGRVEKLAAIPAAFLLQDLRKKIVGVNFPNMIKQ